MTEDTPQKKEDQASQKDKGEKEEEAAIEIELDFGSYPETYASPPQKEEAGQEHGRWGLEDTLRSKEGQLDFGIDQRWSRGLG